MADSSCTRDDRRERIVAECNSVRQALQDLLSEYMGNVGARQILFFLLVYCFPPPQSHIPEWWCRVPTCYLRQMHSCRAGEGSFISGTVHTSRSPGGVVWRPPVSSQSVLCRLAFEERASVHTSPLLWYWFVHWIVWLLLFSNNSLVCSPILVLFIFEVFHFICFPFASPFIILLPIFLSSLKKCWLKAAVLHPCGVQHGGWHDMLVVQWVNIELVSSLKHLAVFSPPREKIPQL